jgi:hypothetical protein
LNAFRVKVLAIAGKVPALRGTVDAMISFSTPLWSGFAMLASITLLLAGASSESRADIDDIDSLTQAQFKPFARDLVSALSYKAISPTEPLGITGFDVGLGLSVIETNTDLPWGIALGSEKSYLTVPRISLQKGLPFGIDVGGLYATIPGTGIQFFGAEVKYALVEGNVALPAIAIRAAAIQLAGLEQLDLETRTVELTISKGLLNFTPYAGVGKIWGDVTPENSALKGLVKLSPESPDMVRVFAGLNFSIFLGSLAIEVEKTGDNFGASTKVGIRF